MDFRPFDFVIEDLFRKDADGNVFIAKRGKNRFLLKDFSCIRKDGLMNLSTTLSKLSTLSPTFLHSLPFAAATIEPEGNICAVWEFEDQISLEEGWSRVADVYGRPPSRVVLEILKRIVNSLEKMHASDLVHGNITLWNLFVSKDVESWMDVLAEIRLGVILVPHACSVGEGKWCDLNQLAWLIFALIHGKYPPSITELLKLCDLHSQYEIFHEDSPHLPFLEEPLWKDAGFNFLGSLMKKLFSSGPGQLKTIDDVSVELLRIEIDRVSVGKRATDTSDDVSGDFTDPNPPFAALGDGKSEKKGRRKRRTDDVSGDFTDPYPPFAALGDGKSQKKGRGKRRTDDVSGDFTDPNPPFAALGEGGKSVFSSSLEKSGISKIVGPPSRDKPYLNSCVGPGLHEKHLLHEMVYVTSKGRKYHAKSCRHASDGIPIPLEEARMDPRYEPCQVCGGYDRAKKTS